MCVRACVCACFVCSRFIFHVKTATNSFCEEWAVALRSVPDKDNPSIVREIVENYKLKVGRWFKVGFRCPAKTGGK